MPFLITAIVLIILVYLISLLPRRNYPGWEAFQTARFAHRGLHNAGAGRPENSMAAFRAAIEKGFGAELDVHLMADGNLAVVHDSDLTRVCGKKGFIEDLRAEGVFGSEVICFLSMSDDDRTPEIEDESARRLNTPEQYERFRAWTELFNG